MSGRAGGAGMEVGCGIGWAVGWDAGRLGATPGADGVLVLVISWEAGLLSRAAGCASALCTNAVYRRWQAAPHRSHRL